MDTTTTVQTISDKFSNNASEALARLITKVTSGIDQASDFLVAQVPDVIHQLLVYNFVLNLALCAAGFIGIFVSIIGSRWSYLHFEKDLVKSSPYRFDKQTLAGLTSTTAVFGTLISALVMGDHFDWLKIWLAPKIWLIEYSVGLIKTTSGH